MSVSVIVSNFNGARFLPKLLESLREQRAVDSEIIVVDRDSTDASNEILAQYEEIKVITERPETGLVSGYAAGAKIASKENLFFCNEDLWIAPGCLRILEDCIDVENRIVAADPWQWTYDGKTWIHGGTRFRRTRWSFVNAFPFRAPDYAVALKHGEITPYPCAGAFLMHRKSYEEVGGWDQSFFLDQEDVDLFLRVWQTGGRVVTAPDAKVYHAVSVSDAKQLTIIRQSVSERRYVSGLSSMSVIVVKHFSLRALPLALVIPLVAILKDLFRCRWNITRRNLLAFALAVRRFPAAWRFRRANQLRGQKIAGEKFFMHPDFVLSEPLD